MQDVYSLSSILPLLFTASSSASNKAVQLSMGGAHGHDVSVFVAIYRNLRPILISALTINRCEQRHFSPDIGDAIDTSQSEGIDDDDEDDDDEEDVVDAVVIAVVVSDADTGDSGGECVEDEQQQQQQQQQQKQQQQQLGHTHLSQSEDGWKNKNTMKDDEDGGAC